MKLLYIFHNVFFISCNCNAYKTKKKFCSQFGLGVVKSFCSSRFSLINNL